MLWPLLLLLLLLLGPALAQPAPYSGVCPNGAQVDQQYCNFFVHYNKGSGQPDTRILDGLQITSMDQTRSIALIIAIAQYPNIRGATTLTAASNDADKLVDFFQNNQKFDEVIVLRDGAASVEAINYFLGNYLPTRGDEFPGKGRLVIAYSGHGTGQSGTTPPAFILSSATMFNDWPHSYSMALFAQSVQNLAGHYFHVLTLINACYGGNFFPPSKGGDPSGHYLPGSYGITAGSDDEVTRALLPARGSVFFDLLVQGVIKGIADPTDQNAYLAIGGQGEVLTDSAFTSTEALHSYLSAAFSAINRRRAPDPRYVALSPPWIGPVKPTSQGAFFFLSPSQPNTPAAMLATLTPYLKSAGPGVTFELGPGPVAGAPAAAAPFSPPVDVSVTTPIRSPDDALQVPPGPVSSIRGHPEIKIFKDPAIYPVHGLILSSGDGEITWPQLQREIATKRYRFASVAATGWGAPRATLDMVKDATFPDIVSHLVAWGVDVSPILRFDFCASPAEQVERFTEYVPAGEHILPPTIELVTPQAAMAHGTAQMACYATLSKAGARNAVLDVAAQLKQRLGKTPILAGNQYNLSVLTDVRSSGYMISVYAYRGAGTASARFVGANPWTIWHYSPALTVAGIGRGISGEVFFGTPEQYALFRAGKANVALAAVE